MDGFDPGIATATPVIPQGLQTQTGHSLGADDLDAEYPAQHLDSQQGQSFGFLPPPPTQNTSSTDVFMDSEEEVVESIYIGNQATSVTAGEQSEGRGRRHLRTDRSSQGLGVLRRERSRAATIRAPSEAATSRHKVPIQSSSKNKTSSSVGSGSGPGDSFRNTQSNQGFFKKILSDAVSSAVQSGKEDLDRALLEAEARYRAQLEEQFVTQQNIIQQIQLQAAAQQEQQRIEFEARVTNLMNQQQRRGGRSNAYIASHTHTNMPSVTQHRSAPQVPPRTNTGLTGTAAATGPQQSNSPTNGDDPMTGSVNSPHTSAHSSDAAADAEMNAEFPPSTTESALPRNFFASSEPGTSSAGIPPRTTPAQTQADTSPPPRTTESTAPDMAAQSNPAEPSGGNAAPPFDLSNLESKIAAMVASAIKQATQHTSGPSPSGPTFHNPRTSASHPKAPKQPNLRHQFRSTRTSQEEEKSRRLEQILKNESNDDKNFHQRKVRALFKKVFDVSKDEEILLDTRPCASVEQVQAYDEALPDDDAILGPDPTKPILAFETEMHGRWNTQCVKLLCVLLLETREKEKWTAPLMPSFYYEYRIWDRFENLRDVWRKGLSRMKRNGTMESAAEALTRVVIDRNRIAKQSRANRRRIETYNVRDQTTRLAVQRAMERPAHQFDENEVKFWEWTRSLILKLGDESPDPDGAEIAYTVHILEWRQDIETIINLIEQRRKVGDIRAKQGGIQRFRNRQGTNRPVSRRDICRGLPIQLYNDTYLMSLTPAGRDRLAVSPEQFIWW